MTPPKQGISTNIGKNLAEMMQFEDLAVEYFYLFYYVHIFVKKIPELVSKAFCMNGKNKIKTFCGKKSFSVFKGAPLSPLNTL